MSTSNPNAAVTPLTMTPEQEAEMRDMVSSSFARAFISELDAERAAHAKTLDALAALVNTVDNLDIEGGDRNLFVSPGCLLCTSGTTPDHRNTGTCAYHRAESVLKENGR